MLGVNVNKQPKNSIFSLQVRFVANKKMPIVQSQETIDFTTATTDEKVDKVFELIQKQRELAVFTLVEGPNLSSNYRKFLLLIVLMTNTNFAVVLASSIENKLYSIDEFINFYLTKLKEHLDESTVIDFLVAE